MGCLWLTGNKRARSGLQAGKHLPSALTATQVLGSQEETGGPRQEEHFLWGGSSKQGGRALRGLRRRGDPGTDSREPSLACPLFKARCAGKCQAQWDPCPSHDLKLRPAARICANSFLEILFFFLKIVNRERECQQPDKGKNQCYILWGKRTVISY